MPAYIPGPHALQYGIGYRMPQPQQPQQQQPVTLPEVDPGQYDALARAMSGKRAGDYGQELSNLATGIYSQGDGLKSAALGGLTEYLAGRNRKKSREELQEAARLSEQGKMAQIDQQARAAAKLALSRGASMEEADAIYEATRAGLEVDLKGDGMSQEEIMKMADNIHDDTKAMMAEYRQAKDITSRIALHADGARTGVKEVMALYDFIKSVDPGSVVRPGETEMVTAASSLLDQFTTKWRNVTKNTMMSDVMYEDLVQLVTKLNEIQTASYRRGFEHEISRATAMGVPPVMVFGEEFLKDLYQNGVPSVTPSKPGAKKTGQSTPYKPGDTLPNGMKIIEILDEDNG